MCSTARHRLLSFQGRGKSVDETANDHHGKSEDAGDFKIRLFRRRLVQFGGVKVCFRRRRSRPSKLLGRKGRVAGGTTFLGIWRPAAVAVVAAVAFARAGVHFRRGFHRAGVEARAVRHRRRRVDFLETDTHIVAVHRGAGLHARQARGGFFRHDARPVAVRETESEIFLGFGRSLGNQTRQLALSVQVAAPDAGSAHVLTRNQKTIPP